LPTPAPRCVRLAAATAAVLAVLLASGCSTQRLPLPAARAIGADVDDLDPASLALAAERSAAALGSGVERRLVIGGRRFSAAELAASAKRVAGIARTAADAATLTRRLAWGCSAYRSAEPARVTAYYEPVLAARGEPDRRFRYPIYSAPSTAQLEEIQRVLHRTPTRNDIDAGAALGGFGLELAWVDDPVARFFLHVQGSGRLDFGGGTQTRVGFAGTNGLAYRSIGSLMIERGLLARGHATAPEIRAWLAAHPGARDGVLAENPRYVFFRDTGGEGPVGAMGTTLVAGRSIASDEREVPRGVLAWLRTTRPGGHAAPPGQPLTRFVFAQDAGAAIRGAARVDLFWGSGEEAGGEAGRMDETGELYLLFCR